MVLAKNMTRNHPANTYNIFHIFIHATYCHTVNIAPLVWSRTEVVSGPWLCPYAMALTTYNTHFSYVSIVVTTRHDSLIQPLPSPPSQILATWAPSSMYMNPTQFGNRQWLIRICVIIFTIVVHLVVHRYWLKQCHNDISQVMERM